MYATYKTHYFVSQWHYSEKQDRLSSIIQITI